MSARGSTDASGNYVSGPPHTVYVYDGGGNLIGSFPQSAAASGTLWGYRDGASNLIGQVFFGWDGFGFAVGVYF